MASLLISGNSINLASCMMTFLFLFYVLSVCAQPEWLCLLMLTLCSKQFPVAAARNKQITTKKNLFLGKTYLKEQA